MQNRFSKKFFAILFFFSVSFSAQIIAQQDSTEITDIGFNEIQIDANLKAKNLEEDFVRAKLEENFQTYSSIRIYDVKNENKILDLQKTNATDFLGQLETSSHIANAVITSSANTASISLKIINIATNAIQSSVTVSVPTSKPHVPGFV